MKPRPKIGLVLGSGGARGWAHLGVIKALRSLGIEPDVITGTSIGALVGAMYAAGVFDTFVEEAESLNFLRLAGFFAEVRLPQHGLFSGRPVMAWLGQDSLLGHRTFDELKLPFAAVATDLYREEAVTLNHGSVVQAVRASISIPGVFDPVLRDGYALVDGGLTDPVPVDVARDLGADVVIAVDVNGTAPAMELPKRHRPPSLLATLLQTTRMVENGVCRLTLERTPADVLIRPQTGHIQTLDFHGGRAAVAEGERATLALRSELMKALCL